MGQKLRRYFYYYRKEIGITLACCFVALVGLVFMLPKSKASSGEIEQDSSMIFESSIKETEIKKDEPVIRVDIKGAVVSPGVYEMKESSRVNDVIYQAGGVLENADLSRINLSNHVVDEMVIIIYTKEQIEAFNESQTKIEYVYVEPECTCPDTVNDACVSSKEENTSGGTSKEEMIQGKISINTATQEELESLPGIGASKAKAILEYREQKPFESIEELKQIKGIGDSLFEQIQDKITI